MAKVRNSPGAAAETGDHVGWKEAVQGPEPGAAAAPGWGRPRRIGSLVPSRGLITKKRKRRS